MIAVNSNGDRYYDHNLTRIEKKELLDLIKDQAVNVEDFGTTPDTESTILSGYKGKKLLSILQTNSSKIVDENGERNEVMRRGMTVNVYKHSVDGVEYTVLTENKRNREEFANFYTNRSGNALTSNTQLSARDDSMTASEGKDTANSSDVQEGKTRFRIANENQRIFVSNAERAVESIKQDKATPQQWKAMIEKQKE